MFVCSRGALRESRADHSPCTTHSKRITFCHASGNGGHGYQITVTLLSGFGFEGREGVFHLFNYGDQVRLPSMCTRTRTKDHPHTDTCR